MEYYKEIMLKNNTKCIVRNAEVSMAKQLLDYRITSATETDFMLRYPHEITDTVKDTEEQILKSSNFDDQIILCAFIGDELVANAGFTPVHRFEKLKHRASFGISVKKEYWHLGIGYELTNAIIEICKKDSYTQLELEVVCTNKSAINLYNKVGFKTFGTNEKAFLLKNGEYVGFYLMCLDL